VTPQPQAVEGLPHLFLVPAGEIPPNPLELLLHETFTRMIDEWQRSFEFIVLDTAPVVAYSDGLAVASVVGRVLTLSRAQHTSYSDTRAMLRRLTATRAQIVGGVISHF
jgi:receptor protein-tyrosine kinase